MPILAIETATTTGSIAIVEEKKVISEITLNIKATHSEKLMAAMDYLLKSSGLTLDEMDGIAVSTGPGSFTGLRIGLSAAKGLSYASGKPLFAIPTLDALASNMSFSRHLICPVLDARKGEVYTALYRSRGQYNEKNTDDLAVKPLELIDIINKTFSEQGIVFLGDGVDVYGNMLKEKLGTLYHEAPLPLQIPRASNVAMLALERLERGDVDDPFTLVPRYIRKSEAELKWKG